MKGKMSKGKMPKGGRPPPPVSALLREGDFQQSPKFLATETVRNWYPGKAHEKQAILESSEKAPEKTGGKRRLGPGPHQNWFSLYRVTPGVRPTRIISVSVCREALLTVLSRDSRPGASVGASSAHANGPHANGQRLSAAASGFGNRAFLYFRGFAVSG